MQVIENRSKVSSDQFSQATQIIREILKRSRITVEEMLLFGSRARDEAHLDSDWDFYVLVDAELPFPQRQYLVTEIKRELARLRIPNDVILKSSEQFHSMKVYPGHLAYEVARDGVSV